MKMVFVTLALAALWFGCAGCATTPPKRVAAGKVTVRTDPAVNPTRATVKLAYEVTIVLGRSRPGYGWQIAQHNAGTLQQVKDFTTNTDGETSVAFLTLRGGLTRVLFTLLPVNSPAESQPADVEEVQLLIEN
jgi:hypothetical protein